LANPEEQIFGADAEVMQISGDCFAFRSAFAHFLLQSLHQKMKICRQDCYLQM